MTAKLMTVDEAAKTLRRLAEMTAANSKNWDNYEAICRDMIQAAYNAQPQESKK